jgi:predicted aldo/keto reductase-like oxidoreductase
MSKKINRRQALQIMGAGAAGLAGAGLWNRKQIIDFFDRDATVQGSEADGKVVTRLYPSNGAQVSLLGFGGMRFPTRLTASGKVIDEEISEKMIAYAYRHGVNYYDTAYFYHDGKSEAFMGNVLKQYPRNSFYLCDKMPTPVLKSLDQAKEIFQRQLETCQVQYFDNYLLHSLSSRDIFDELYVKGGILEYLHSEKEAGRIRCLGFSFHGDVPFFNYLMDNFAWDCVMIQLNYADWNDEGEQPDGSKQGGSLYRKAVEKNVPVFVMEPVKGGNLAQLSVPASAILKEENHDASAASWALRYVGSLPAVVTMLSGMSSIEQVIDNIHTMANFHPLSEKERRILARSMGKRTAETQINCTYCRYCDPCPYGVDIAGIFHVYNTQADRLDIDDGTASAEAKKEFLIRYQNEVNRSSRAGHCSGCNECLPRCPQHIAIPQQVQQVDALVRKLADETGKVVI